MTIFERLGKALAPMAPTVANMLGGPLAGMAVTAVEGVLGLNKGAGADACLEALKSAQLTPDQIVAIKRLDLEHEEKLKQNEIDLEQINKGYFDAEVADRKSAREMYESTRDRTTPILAWTIICAFLSIVVAIVTGHITKDVTYKELIGVVIGYLFNEAKAVTSFYFGDNRASQRKTATLSEIAKMP